MYPHQPQFKIPTKITPRHNVFQKNISTNLITNSYQKHINVTQYQVYNSTINSTTTKQQNKKKYNQHVLSPRKYVQYLLLDPLPTQSITFQQTCISPSIVYRHYSVDCSKPPRGTNVSNTLSRFYNINPRPPV